MEQIFFNVTTLVIVGRLISQLTFPNISIPSYIMFILAAHTFKQIDDPAQNLASFPYHRYIDELKSIYAWIITHFYYISKVF